MVSYTVIKAIIFDLGDTLIIQGNSLGSIQPFQETQSVLQHLQSRYKLALITNVLPTTTAEYVHEVLHEAGLHDFFEVITVSSSVGVSKPSRAIFELTLTQLGVKPDEAVMVGDTIATDIFGGNVYGMTTVLVQRGQEYQLREKEKPNHTISSLTELLRLLDEKKQII
jgi:putative hydrolase of the HAD superfamily